MNVRIHQDHHGALWGFMYAVGRAMQDDARVWWEIAGDTAIDAMHHTLSSRSRAHVFATAARCYARAEPIPEDAP